MSERQPTVEYGCHAPRDGDDRTGTLIRTPYDADFVDAIKGTWRHGTRLWSPEDECWWVEAGAEDEVTDLVEHHYGSVRIIHEDGGEEIRDAGGTFEQRGFFA